MLDKYFKLPFISVEHKGFDWPWGNGKQECDKCSEHSGCNQTVCVGYEGKAKTFESVCEAMNELHDKKEVITILIALGECANLLTKDSKP